MAIKVADAFVMVGGDLSKYRADLKAGEKDVQSLAQQIKAALTNPSTFGGTSRIAGFIADLKNGHTRMDALRTLTTGLGADIKRTFSSSVVSAFHGGLNGVKAVLGGLKGLASDVFKGFSIGLGIGSFQALGRVLSDLVNIIPDLIHRGRDYSRIVDDIGDATGATTEQASKFASTLLFLGVPLNGVINMVGQMSRNLEEQGPTLERLGIKIRGTNGALLNQLQILDNARQAMSKWGLGTSQADQIAREFGRGGLKTLVDYLHLTDEQFNRITEDARASGLILTDAQRDLGESMIREEARFQNALTGLGETIFTVVGPQIRAFMSQLSDFIQQHVTEISNAISQAISFILGLVGSLAGATGSLDSFAGSIQAANSVQSPYASHLLDLRVELAKLDEQTDKAADSTSGLRDAIQGQIKAIDRQIEALRRVDRAQDTVFKREIANLARVYQLRLDNLDLAERERENARRQLDLNEQLNEAVLDLARARRGTLEDGVRVVDAEAVSDAMARITDIQRAQADNAHDLEVDAQRKSLETTRDYIKSIGELVENAENKKAALNTLRRREDVLEARRQKQLASGDTAGADETGARIEAIKTAQVRAQEMIRNEARENALDNQKSQLQEELSNVASASSQATAIRKKELEKQIADIAEFDRKWNLMTDQQKANLLGVTDTVAGPTGLTAAMEEARRAGEKFGESLKTALGDVVDLFKQLFGWFADIKTALDDIANNDVWKFLTEPIKPPWEPTPKGSDTGKVPRPATPPRRPLVADVPDVLLGVGETFTPTSPENAFDRAAIDREIARRRAARRVPEEFAEGGVVDGPRGSPVPVVAHGGEGVVALDLMDKLRAFFSTPMTPALAGGGGGPAMPAFGPTSEGVLPFNLMATLQDFFSRPMAPALAGGGAGAGGGITEVHTHLYLDSREISESVSRVQDGQYKR